MRAGRMNRLFSLEKATIAQDSYGEPDKTWVADKDSRSVVITFWGERTPLAGNEIFDRDAQTDRTEQRYQVVTHYSSTLKGALLATKRMTEDSVTYDIETATDPDGRRRELVITAVVRG